MNIGLTRNILHIMIKFRVNGHNYNDWEYIIPYLLKVMLAVSVIVITNYVAEGLNNHLFSWTRVWIVKPDNIYKLFNEHHTITSLFSLTVIFGAVWFGVNFRKDKYFSLPMVMCSIVLCIILLKQDKWEYAPTLIRSIHYDWFVAGLLFVFIIWSFSKLFVVLKEKPNQHKKIVSFMTDNTDDVIPRGCRDLFAANLADELLNTNIGSEAFAVAITGGWGSGKTVFLVNLKRKIGNQAVVVDYKPWNSQDESHLVKDFFDTLAKELTPYYSGIDTPLKKYVKLLYSMRLHFKSDLILQYLPLHEPEDLESRKCAIEEALACIGRPIVITIDDLDRLEAKEIFEVLRIIRNTAQFKNVIYVVTYDKGYVSEQLEEELHVGKDYLEKIFQLELTMPKVDERTLEEAFKNECRIMCSRTSIMNNCLDNLSENDYYHIGKHLYTYRKVRRFARQFTFNSNFMLESFSDLSLLDMKSVMMLNLIQSIDDRLYGIMWMRPNELFDEKRIEGNGSLYYKLKENLNMEKWGMGADYFMRRMFDDEPRKPNNSIQMKDSYYKYFNLTQPEKELNDAEFASMLKKPNNDAGNGMRASVRGWILSKNSKSSHSIFRQFSDNIPSTYRKQTAEEDAKKLISAVGYWLEYEYRSEENVNRIVCEVMRSAIYNHEVQIGLKSWAKQVLYRVLRLNQFEKMAGVLIALYEYLEKGNKLLLDRHELRNMIFDVFSRLADYQEWDAVLLVREDGNMLRETIDKCMVVEVQTNKQINLMIDAAIIYFSQDGHRSNNTVEASKWRENLKLYKLHSGVSTPGYDRDHIEMTFGRDLNKLEEYIDKCFNW